MYSLKETLTESALADLLFKMHVNGYAEATRTETTCVVRNKDAVKHLSAIKHPGRAGWAVMVSEEIAIMFGLQLWRSDMLRAKRDTEDRGHGG